MDNEQVEIVAKAIAPRVFFIFDGDTKERAANWEAHSDNEREEIAIIARAAIAAYRPLVIEECAAYIEGGGYKIPGTVAFATLVSGNRQPCMSGDPRDRLDKYARRAFDNATQELATALRSMKEQGDG